MGNRGPQPTWDTEEAFYWWFNEGRRRPHREVAAHYGISLSTVQKHSSEYDWRSRADDLDLEQRRATERRIAETLARARADSIEIGAALLRRFGRRLVPTLEDGSPNPDYLPAAAMSVKDFDLLAKYLELVSGHATERVASDEWGTSLEELEQQVRELTERETQSEEIEQ